MNLLIRAEISEPPTETLAFRHFTAITKIDIKFDNLLLCTKQNKDLYYHFLQPRGYLDYIADLVEVQEKIDGIHLDFELNYPLTVITNKIVFQNIDYLTAKIKELIKII